MKFLSDILAKAGLTVDGVVTLNNTATGQTPNANDNSTKLATTAWVRTFVQPYSLPIASASVLGGVKIGNGLSINSGTGVLSVTGGGTASIKSTQTFIATAGQTVFTISGGYTPNLIDVFLNGVYLSPNQTTASNGTTITLSDAALVGDIIDVIVAAPIYEGATTTTDQLPEGVVNLYYTNARARAAISLTVTGTSGASTYDSGTGVLNIPTYTLAGLGGVPTGRTLTIDGVSYDLSANRTWNILPTGGAAGDILAKNSATNYDVTWIPNYTSQVQHTVKLAQDMTIGTPVYVSGSTGQAGTNMLVSKASNVSEGTSSKTLGLIAFTGSTNDTGFVITEGLLAGLDTSAAGAAGDPVWLGPTGTLIYGLLNKPYAPAHLVFIGVVTRKQPNNGEIFVKVQNGYELEELHNLSVKDAADGDMIKYVASTGLWTKIAATTTNIAEGTNLYYTQTRFDTAFAAKSTTNLAEGTNLYYTNARARAAISVTGSGSYDSATGIITVTGGVTSVNTLTGAVTLTTTNIGEGTNLYYTTARVNSDFDTRLATKSTTNLAEGLNLYYTDARVGSYLSTNSYATQSYVATQIANLVASAPAALDTLNELAAALGNDASFSTTISTALGNRLRVDINTQGLSATLQGYGRTNLGLGSLATLSSIGNSYITDLAYSKLTGVPSTFAPSAHTHVWTDITDRPTNLSAFTNGPGYITGITSGNVTTALGYTPYNSTNPSGYITSSSNISGSAGSLSDDSGYLRTRGGGSEANLDTYTDNGVRSVSFTGHSQHLLTWNGGGSTGTIQQLFHYGTPSNGWRIRNKTDNSSWSSWGYVVMATGNQGHISGTIYHSGNLTNLNQLSNGPGYITGYTETDTLASVTGRGANTTSAITINRNVAGLIFNRDAVTNYNGIYYSTAGSAKWFIGMRENLSSNNHIHYSEALGVDVLTLNQTTGAATFSSTIMAAGGNSSQWNTAYSWGNHAGLYLPIGGGLSTGWVRFSSNTQGTPIIKAVQEDTTSGYYLFQGVTGSTEVFRVERTGNIVTSGTLSASGYNASNWNTAYGWGNHASAGYITGISSGNVTTALGYTPYNSSNPAGYVTTSGLSTDIDSEQTIGGKIHYFNSGATRMNIDPRWNESGYDADLGCFHIWSWTAAGVAYGRAGIALYNGSAYQYLTTQGGQNNIYVNNNVILHAGNYSSYAIAKSGGTMSGNLVLSSISGVAQTVPNTHGAYLHLGAWGVGRTDTTAVLVNTAYRADYATDLFDMNISRFTNNSGYITTSALGSYVPYSNLVDSFGLSDNKLYLRTKGDENHFLWNAADDWEELRYYTGTGFRIQGSTGSVPAYFTNAGIYAAAFRGKDNVAGTGEAVYAPAGLYSTGNNWLYGTMYQNGNIIRDNGGIVQNSIVGYPNAQWGATGATGPVIISFPGNTGNYGMIHAVIDIYEYSGNNVCTIIVGGHNWGGSQWYNYGAQVIGYTDKPVRVGIKDGRYCIIIGNSGSSWSYGQVVLRKIQNGSYYSGIMDVGAGYSVGIGSDSYTWASSDLRDFRTSSSATINGYLTVRGAGTSASIYMADDDEGQREIHCNSNRIGFLTQAGAWGSWCDDSGNWGVTGSVNAADGSFGTGSSDQGIYINYTNYVSGYGRIRFRQDGSNHSTIHSFSASWQSSSAYAASTGCINIDGQYGTTIGPWNAHHAAITSEGIAIKSSATPSGAMGWNGSAVLRLQQGSTGDNVFLQFRNRADAGDYAGLLFADNNIGGYLGFRTYASNDVANGSDCMIYGTYNDHIFQNGTSGTFNGKTETFRIYGNGSVRATGDVTAYSDARVKENVVTIDKALQKTLQLRGVYYNRTDKDDKSQKIGVIAQEIQQVLPQVVSEDYNGLLSVSYGNLAGIFIEAIKEQQLQIESQKTEIEELKDLVKQLINR